jgi:hypothetical protein
MKLTGHEVEWWYPAAVKHAEADHECPACAAADKERG